MSSDSSSKNISQVKAAEFHDIFADMIGEPGDCSRAPEKYLFDNSDPFSVFNKTIDGIGDGGEIHVTLFAAANGRSLTKRYALADDGELAATTAAQLVSGKALPLRIRGLKDLQRIIEAAGSEHAIAYGQVRGGRHNRPVRVTTAERLRRNPVSRNIARTREHFRWAVGEPGILTLDVDLPDDRPNLTPERFDGIMRGIIPVWGDIGRLFRYSASSGIERDDGTALKPLRNFKCYVVVSNAEAVETIGAGLYRMLWDAGYGYIRVNKNGIPLDRSIIDATVWQPERLDFIGPARTRARPAAAEAVAVFRP